MLIGIIILVMGCVGMFVSDYVPPDPPKYDLTNCDSVDIYDYEWCRYLSSGPQECLIFKRDNKLNHIITFGNTVYKDIETTWHFVDSTNCNTFVRDDHYYFFGREYNIVLGEKTLAIQYYHNLELSTIVFKKRE